MSSALAEFEVAAADIRKMPRGKAAPGIERKYGLAYQRLVREGSAPQIRQKYRGGK